MKTFGQALAENQEYGDYVPMSEMVNVDIVVTAYDTIDTHWGDATVIHASEGGEDRDILTWSTVLKKQLDLVQDELPLEGRIVEIGNYYTFSDPSSSSEEEV